MNNNFFVVGFDTHKGTRYVDIENTNWGTNNEYDARQFESRELAQIFIDNDKDAERLYILECEPLDID